MAYKDCNSLSQDIYGEFRQILDALDDSKLLLSVGRSRIYGRPGYDVRTMWNAYLAAFYLNLPSTNSLIRRLEDDEPLRVVCGFEDVLPCRRTFNRFIRNLADYTDLIEQCNAKLVSYLKTLLPGFGEMVAIDATAARTHSNPNKRSKVTGEITDPDARWGVKHSAKSKEKECTEFFFGYKVHMVADATHDLPIGFTVTPGNESDSPEMREVMDKTFGMFKWFKPKVALADRGYDAMENFNYLFKKKIDPIIHIRKPTAEDKLYDGIYNEDALPLCMGMKPMEYIGDTGDGKRIFRCASEGCSLKDSTKGGTRHCDTVIEENPLDNIRVHGPITRRGSPEWREMYGKRWSVERVFKSMKESRRLEDHHVRELKHITLHAAMSTLTFQATRLVKELAGEEDKGWMVRKIA